MLQLRAVATGATMAVPHFHSTKFFTRSEVMQVHSRLVYVHTWYSEIMAVKPEDIGDFPLEPFQPKHIAFPSQSFRKSAQVSRLFQTTWFNKFASLVPRPSARGVVSGSGNLRGCTTTLRRMPLAALRNVCRPWPGNYCICTVLS
jgi:hypothetical protein